MAVMQYQDEQHIHYTIQSHTLGTKMPTYSYHFQSQARMKQGRRSVRCCIQSHIVV
jgi:hypothetical protein